MSLPFMSFHLCSFHETGLIKPVSERHLNSLEFPLERVGELLPPNQA